jgi:8-oxo-dGTP pyrophosphatase MutT (NUDIX family)
MIPYGRNAQHEEIPMKIATLGIVLKGGKVLLGEKKKGEIGTGVLSGPGGKLDPGETLEECLIRETREELKIELDPASLVRTRLPRTHLYREDIVGRDS